MKTKDLNKIIYNEIETIKYHEPKKIYDVNAIDTETYNGFAYLITYSENDDIKYKHLYNSYECSKFLLNDNFHNKINFFFNLDYDVRAIIKHINDIEIVANIMKGNNILINPSKSILKKLYKYKNKPLIFYNDKLSSNIGIHYIKNKCFKITDYSRKTNNFYDLFQYFNSSLDNAVLTQLNYCSKCNYNIGFYIFKFETKLNFKRENLKTKNNTLTKIDIFPNDSNIKCPKCNNEHIILRKIKIKNEQYNIYDELFKKDFIKYALHDTYITLLLGNKLMKLFKDFNIHTNKVLSKAYISQLVYSQHNEFIDKIKDKKLLKYSIMSMFGGRFEMTKRGKFDSNKGEKIYQYDINSAYPDIMHKLKSTYKADIYFYKGFLDKFETYDYGFIKCIINQDNYINPLIYQFNPLNNKLFIENKLNHYNKLDKLISFPSHKYISYITLNEYLTYRDIIDIEVIDGIYIKCNSDVKPFNYLKDLYYERLKLKKENNPLEHLVKIILNSTYGKTLQLTPVKIYIEYNKELMTNKDKLNNLLKKYGNLKYKRIRINDIYYLEFEHKYKSGLMFNTIFSSKITSDTRINLIKPFINNKKNKFIDLNSVILFATDSITSTKKLNIKLSNKLGDWDLENEGDGLFIGNGLYQINNKTKKRGFKINMNLNSILNEHKKDSIIKFIVKQNINYVGLDNLDTFNIIHEQDKHLNINFDRKRHWKKDLLCEDLLENNFDSKPLKFPAI